jgi:hypothetical protein
MCAVEFLKVLTTKLEISEISKQNCEIAKNAKNVNLEAG